MSRRNTRSWPSQAGFTLVELMVVIVVAGVIAAAIGEFFNTTLIQYFKLQQDATDFTSLAAQSQRIANVVRGLTDIISANNNDLTIYAYFSPSDAYVSQVHYYLDASNTDLLATVTPMTANPPTGTLITGSAKTYTVISNFYKASNVNLFAYLDASNTAEAVPLADEHTVQAIQINLAAQTSKGTTGQTLNLQVSLRNRKVNL